jgi:hypothetical protein
MTGKILAKYRKTPLSFQKSAANWAFLAILPLLGVPNNRK